MGTLKYPQPYNDFCHSAKATRTRLMPISRIFMSNPLDFEPTSREPFLTDLLVTPSDGFRLLQDELQSFGKPLLIRSKFIGNGNYYYFHAEPPLERLIGASAVRGILQVARRTDSTFDSVLVMGEELVMGDSPKLRGYPAMILPIICWDEYGIA